MYRQLLLDSRNQTIITTYEKLVTLKPNAYNLLWLSHFFKLSYKKTVSIIEDIDLALKNFNPDLDSIITEDTKIIISDSLPEVENLVSYLIQNDLPFNFLINIIEEKYKNLNEFSYRYFVSPSTARRKLAPLKKFFNSYRVSLQLSTMDIVGDERVIRDILVSLLWLSSRGLDLSISQLDITKIDETIRKSLVICPKCNHLPPTFLFRKLDADVAYHRIKKGHYVEDDPCYDMVISEDLLLSISNWGELVEAPVEHHFAETRYMAFRQYCGQVFFDENDPIFKIPRSELPNRTPTLDRFLNYLTDFIEEEVFDFDDSSSFVSDGFNVLKGNISMVFFSYYVYKTNQPSLFLLAEAKIMMTNRIFVFLYEKFKKKLEFLAEELEFQWMRPCLKEMSMIFTAMILPEYELSAKQFHLAVSLIFENNYIYSHRLEVFLKALPYIDYQVFEKDNIEKYDVIVVTSNAVLPENIENTVIRFPYSLNEKHFSTLNNELQNSFIKKNRLHYNQTVHMSETSLT